MAEATHSLALQKLGDDAQALTFNDLALQRLRNQKLRLATLGTRALIFNSLGRYEEARALIGEITSLGGAGASAMGIVAAVELHSGRVDEAIAMARAVVAADPPTDQPRNVLARALRTKGDFAAALAVLDPAPADGSKLFRAVDLTASQEATASAERLQARVAATWEAFRWLAIAQVHVDAGDGARAQEALDGCAPLIGVNRLLEAGYQHALARACALRGDAAKVEVHLARVREIVAAHPRHSRGLEDTFSAGCCALDLGQDDKALTCLTEAMALAKHPIERHVIRFKMAEAHARAGQKAEAAESYRQVVADGFSTVFHARAVEALR
jgi:tetratricopeptide (TPR) repeat protein